MLGFSAFVTLFGGGLLIALVVAWVLMPFMLAGVRRGVQDMVKQQARTNELLAQLLRGDGGAAGDDLPRAPVDRRYPPV